MHCAAVTVGNILFLLATWLVLPGDWYSFELCLLVIFFYIMLHIHVFFSLFLSAPSIISEFVHALA